MLRALRMTAFLEDLHGPDLRHRILYTALLLLLFRFLAAIPVLNVDEWREEEKSERC